MLRIICDRCGTEIKDGDEYYRYGVYGYGLMGEYIEGAMIQGNMDKDPADEADGDLCRSCRNELIEFMKFKPWCGNQESKDVLPAPALNSGGTKNRHRIDYGKIGALTDAGWAPKKIADEMGMTVQGVYVAQSKVRKMRGSHE